MTFLLDTNICIYALEGMFPGIADRLRLHVPADIKIASIVRGELLLGAHKSQRPRRTLRIVRAFLEPFESFPFCDRAADRYGHLRSELERSGKTIGPNDLILAATALSNDVILVTHNTRELRRVKGLRLEDWTRPPE